ncbi:MAG: hypothetical protein EXR75_15620 [Myxococcales bacterium]|nr:hypothetical protein [Myxococcales bacterium]
MPLPVPQGPVGNIVVQVIGGSCDIAVDGTSVGVRSEYVAKVNVGDHTVTCTVPGATPLRDEVTVRERGRPSLVTFTLKKLVRTPPEPAPKSQMPWLKR